MHPKVSQAMEDLRDAGYFRFRPYVASSQDSWS